MKRPALTYEMAHAAAMDAATRAMRAAGRKAWNQDDYDIFCREFAHLYPDPHN